AADVIRGRPLVEPCFDEPREAQGDSCSNATHGRPQLSARRAWAIPKLACPESRWATTCGTRTAKTAKMSAPPRTSRSGLVGPKNVLDGIRGIQRFAIWLPSRTIQWRWEILRQTPHV